jgi:dTDP-glucose 4,6-dehydratase
MRILVTGVTGFIGSHFAKQALRDLEKVQVIGLARNSDQKNLSRISTVHEWEWSPIKDPRFQLIYGDLCDKNAVSGLCEGIDVVVNFAAKTFVDHSLKDCRPFLESNVIGAMNLMDDARRYGVKRFVQVSTDEVYGQILTGAYKEDATLNPRNPYAWSKACADLYAIQLERTYGFPVIITRTENNFGGWQHRQKAIPTFVRAALANEPLPVYGDGLHVRCWLHVEEHCRAIWHLIQKSFEEKMELKSEGESAYFNGRLLLGEVFHIAGEEELTNLELARIILRTLGKPEDMIRHVPDHDVRPGHDRRYALDCSKLKATGFTIKQDLLEKLAETVKWYEANQEWMR